MIVAILLSYLVQINKREHFRDVYLGVAAAFVLVLLGGIGAYFLIKQYDGSNVQTYFETATYIIAAGFLWRSRIWSRFGNVGSILSATLHFFQCGSRGRCRG